MGWTTGETKQTNKPSAEQLGTWQTLMQLLTGRYAQGPYSFNEFRQSGGEPRPYVPITYDTAVSKLVDPSKVNPAVQEATKPSGAATPHRGQVVTGPSSAPFAGFNLSGSSRYVGAQPSLMDMLMRA